MKVLVSGPVESGDAGWTQLLNRTTELHTGKHGPFDLLIVVPSPANPPKPESIHFPLQVAFETGVFGEHIAVEIVSGGQKAPTEPVPPVDILVTDVVPEHSGIPVALRSDQNAADWALAVAPRYHFCGSSGTYFQRTPYRNAGGRPVTRLIALGSVGGKEKWIHALSVTKDLSGVEPPGTSENPYINVKASVLSKPVQSNQEHSRQQFFFASGDAGSSAKRQRPGGDKKPRRDLKIPPRLDCWFCLASPSCEQHLIASIGEEAYVALPKGGIRKEHVLIVPISHETSFSQFISTEEAINEVVMLQNQVEQAFAKGGFGVLYTDRSLTFGKAPQQHGYLECLPVPITQIEALEKTLHEEAKAKGISFECIGNGMSSNRDNLNIIKSLDEYLFIQLPGGKAFVHRAQKSSTEDGRMRAALLQFGRNIACRLLNCPDRAHWKSCVASKSQETAWTKMISDLMPQQQVE